MPPIKEIDPGIGKEVRDPIWGYPHTYLGPRVAARRARRRNREDGVNI